jgi:uncharacterized membrane protein YjfL (UPF0719 family)
MSSGMIASFYGATFVFLLVLHRLFRPILGRGSAQLLGAENDRAVLAGEAGNVLALAILAGGVVKANTISDDLATDALWCAVFATLGLVLLEPTCALGNALLLHKRLRPSIAAGNVAAGLAAALHAVSMGLLASRAAGGGDLPAVGLALVFFALAVAAHQVMVGLFRLLTTYDDSEQIEGENVAAAVSWGGISLAVAVVVSRALEGDFVDWPSALGGFGALSLATLAFYPVRQLLVQGVVLGTRPTFRGGALDDAIGVDRNVGAAMLEAAAYVGTALAIRSLA